MKPNKKIIFSLLVIIVFAILLSGCASGISQEELGYFNQLSGKTFWTTKPLNIDIEKYGKEKVTLFADTKLGTYEGIKFDKISITEKSKRGNPLKGYISADIIDNSGDVLFTYRINISKSNEKTLKQIVPMMETDQQKVTNECSQMVANGKYEDAIAKLKTIQRTDEVKKLLDEAYFGIAEEDFKQAKYSDVLSMLSNIKYDKDTIEKTKELASKAKNCKELLSEAKTLKAKAEYSEAVLKLKQLKQLSDTPEVENLLKELQNPWLLDSKGIKDAVTYGTINKNKNAFALLRPWTYGNVYSYQTSIIVFTPYCQVVYTAQDNAKKYKQTTLSDALKILEENDNHLIIFALLYGDEIDFAEDIDMVVKVNGKAIQPIKSDKTDIADLNYEWIYNPSYHTINSYDFDNKSIPRNAKIQVIVIYPDKEKVFNVDLSKLK